MSEEIEEQIEGMVDKDKKYRNRLIANIKHKKDHPFHNGIHMAAHHLISNKGVLISELGDVLVHRGYNINLVENLVFLPSTLQGACQLRVQLHRYNHTYALPNQAAYHVQVASALVKVRTKVLKCVPKVTGSNNEIQSMLNSISEDILQKVAEFRIPLTPIFNNFKPSSKTGCANKVEISECKGVLDRCNQERNHNGELDFLNPKAEFYKSGKIIDYNKSYYKLRVGR
ncbi:AHH domain-containing protein [Pseudoalteromonas sp. DY56-GL79]|uniref:AHH domain-containing protein n=1 Tax=Pseudoalteromonas sp. DY56-GL79 TaxID=2967131 RepID=UPI00352A997B